MTHTLSSTTATDESTADSDLLDVDVAAAGAAKSLFTPRSRVLILTAVIAVGVAAALGTMHNGTAVDRSHIVVFACLTVAFALSEKLIFHIEARRDAVSYTPSEIGLAIGLLFLFPLELVAARTIGALIGMVIIRRPPLFKLLFNLAHFAIESLVAVIVFRAISALNDDLLVTWLALLVSLTVALVVGGVLVALAVSQFEGGARSRIAQELVGAPVFHLPAAVVATLIAVSIKVDPRLGLIAATPAPVVWYMIRSHGALLHQHRDLTSVHDFGQTVLNAISIDEIGVAAVESMAEGSTARTVVLRLWDGDDRAIDAAVGAPFDTSVLPSTATDHQWSELMTRREIEQIDETSAPTPHVLALRSIGMDCGIVAPIADERGPLGVAVFADHEDASAAFDHDGIDRVVAMAQKLAVIVRKARLHSQIEHEAAHDRLTGLPNRSQFEAAVNDSIEKSHRHAVLLIDLDRFKDINDSFGHQAGDRVLIEAARRIRLVAGPDSVAARFGGDEFALIAPGLDAAAASLLADRVSNALEQPIDIGRATVAVGASVGIALAPDHARDANSLLHCADLAMYNAKAGSCRSSIYEAEFDATGAARITLLSDLRGALQYGLLDVQYQPQIDLKTGRVIGAEALVRWTHPRYGSVDPATFIGLAEQSGMIEELTRQVLAKATSAAAEWARRGWGMSVSVNISPQSLLDERLEALVADAVNSSGLDPARLILEITETTMMGDASRTHRILHSLARLGVKLSVDDFGTGYSSLTNLRHFPVAELKIDRSFVLDLMNDSTDDVIVRSTIELGHNLGLTIVAEGVEDLDVQQRLAELDCDIVQGFEIARPMPLAEFIFWLGDRVALAADKPAAEPEVPRVPALSPLPRIEIGRLPTAISHGPSCISGLGDTSRDAHNGPPHSEDVPEYSDMRGTRQSSPVKNRHDAKSPKPVSTKVEQSR